MGESEWEKEKPKLLKMIEEKQDQLNDFEKVSSVIWQKKNTNKLMKNWIQHDMKGICRTKFWQLCHNMFQLINRPQLQRTFLCIKQLKLWNSLPRAITATDGLHTFKKKLREFPFRIISCQLVFIIIIILTFRHFTLIWVIYMLVYIGSEKPRLGDSIKVHYTLL